MQRKNVFWGALVIVIVVAAIISTFFAFGTAGKVRAANPPMITVTIGAHGTAKYKIDGEETWYTIDSFFTSFTLIVDSGTTVLYKFTPDNEYNLDTFTDNGVNKNPTRNGDGDYLYEISYISSNHTLDVTFKSMKNQTPTIAIDFAKEELYGFELGIYKINGGQEFTANGTTRKQIDSNMFGTTISIIRAWDSITPLDSDPQSLAIPTRPAAPTSPAGGQNCIQYVHTSLEYKSSDALTWQSITDSTVTGLAAGTYQIRFKATGTSFASAIKTVTVMEGPTPPAPPTPALDPEPTPTATIDFMEERLIYAFGISGPFKINGEQITTYGLYANIQEAWFGTTVSIIKTGNGTTTKDSEPQNLFIPARRAAPNVMVESDYWVTNLYLDMEYKAQNSYVWIPITRGLVGPLAAGTYEFRYVATPFKFNSSVKTLTITDATPPTPPPGTTDPEWPPYIPPQEPGDTTEPHQPPYIPPQDSGMSTTTKIIVAVSVVVGTAILGTILVVILRRRLS